ncbi:hypothetical protein F5Y07DRAFT_331875 [Xylaria sp. FL0933]|nr:hypothetical protein F5Y07DRAFT_331875 [Xylaria sp. FL0933]
MPVDTIPPVDTTMASASFTSRSRALSTSSDRPSTIGVHSLMSPPLSVSPEAAFIAASAASQIVTNDHDTHSATWYDQVGIEPAEGTALVSSGALLLANNFVDQLLFNVLATAGSTSLASLRSAVIDVLKPKLAKDVINSADEELREYLGGGEIENLARSAPSQAARDWDLELVWKRTRLRCMVYSSLGDMEEEDEDYYVEREHLDGETGESVTELVSPAVAIFLTSILEFMGEQVLIVAGQAAFNRLRVKYEKELKDGTLQPGDVCERIVVEELDMERVALDRTLGRLWRAWKKRIRSPMEPNFSRPFSRSSANGFSASHQRRESTATEPPAVQPSLEEDTSIDDQPSQSHGIQDGTEQPDGSRIEGEGDILDPSTLPLPDSDIEASYSDEEESEQEELPLRPKSWVVMSHELDGGNPFASKASVKRTPSLPPRRKPRYSAFVAKDESAVEPTEVTQLSETPETKIEAEAVIRTEARPNEPIDIVVQQATADATSQTGIKDEEMDGDIEDFAEEPEILTSSRVSVEGRSSPLASESGRPSSIVLTRSSSVRSVRVIEVQAPRSRASSIESNPRSPTPRSFSISREGSISTTPPIVEEKDPHVVPYVTVTKTSGTASWPEAVADVHTSLTPPPRNRLPAKSTPATLHPATSVSSKVSVISNPISPPQEERHDTFQRPISGLRNPPMPTLPERSANRPVYVQTTSAQRQSPDSPRFPRQMQSEVPSPARFKPKRASEESSSRPVDVARDFEQLIQSNETLQYTLTPENMRDIDSQSSQTNGSPNTSHKSRRSDDGRFSERSRSSSIKRSISVNKSTGLASHPPTDMVTSGRYGNATSKALPPVSSRNRAAAVPQARDARVPRESMQDFADFIRSTGPPVTNANRTDGSLASNSHKARSVTRSPSIAKSSSVETRRAPKLQARDAVVNTSNESSELIDFIRQGPPSSNGNNHRIPRTVAPFRNTQDSDYMTSAVGGKAIDAVIPNVRTSQASTNITEASAPSSMNSQSALLNKSNRQQLYAGNSFDDDPRPKRTQRRVRDPYAIDFSDDDVDEEDDEFETFPKPQPKPKQEESLIDFLNNYPPPAEPPTQFIAPPKKKSSAPNLIARLRSGSSAGINGSGHIRKGSNVSENRSSSSRVGTKATHTPIVIPPVVDRYAPAIKSSSPRNASFGRAPMRKFEPREASLPSSQMTDLANFFRDSGPPPPLTTYTPPPEDKSSSGFSRMFERRKKPTAY